MRTVLSACCMAACSACLLHGRTAVCPRSAPSLMAIASADLELEMVWCARIVREVPMCGSNHHRLAEWPLLLLTPVNLTATQAADMLAEADADAAVQLLEFEMTQERLGMGPAEGCVGGRSWLCHVDEHVVSLALAAA